MSEERRFRYRAAQSSLVLPHPYGGGEDVLPIRLRFFTVTGTRSWVDGSVTYSEPTYVCDKYLSILLSRVKVLSDNLWYKVQMSKILLDMGVPQDVRPRIVTKAFKVIDDRSSTLVPKRVVDVIIKDFKVVEEEADVSAAIEGSLERLVVVKDDDQEQEQEESCAICMQSLVVVDGQQEQEMIVATRLPCSHYYHRRCIIHWLNIKHVCPMCRYPVL